MLKRERVSFEKKVVDSDRKVMWFETEMKRVANWARERQTEYNQAASNLQKLVADAKQETVDVTMSINMDLASELESLRYEAAGLINGEEDNDYDEM